MITHTASVSQVSPLLLQAVQCISFDKRPVVSVWDDAYKRTLAADRKE